MLVHFQNGEHEKPFTSIYMLNYPVCTICNCLQDNSSLAVMTDLMAAFKAALQQIDDSEENNSKFKVVGSEGRTLNS